ncbi:MAG: glucan biosynthesis protein [Gemmobacter sp.]|uniref:glucan biosynthesis protein n=1 Tax=Gemmobacter sp. TaxID=1898957 RepID=UPI00391AFFBC
MEPALPLPFRPLSAALTLAAALMAAAPGLAQQTAAPFVPVLGAPAPFSFELLADRAKALALAPYVPTPVEQPEVLEKIDYDAHWRIRFRPEATVMAGKTPVQFFHLGTYFRQPVKMFITTGDTAQKVTYDPGFFDMPEDSPARGLTRGAGFAGFRIMRPDLKSDWISFLGAAYFRTDGALRQYGQSARALALDTGLPTPEEFPRFTEFYIGEAEDGRVLIHALMDGPRVAGAYRMAISHVEGQGQVMEIDSRLFFRAAVERLGVAPLTSMFWYSETNRYQATDWRPEVHDTDGLMLLTGAGEQIWRPLNNPDRVVTSSFADENPRGFGLVQRDRAFASYEDDGVFYDRRPAVWVEPTHGWGKGAVQLVEIPTDDEIYDNIVAFWNPAEPPQAGSERAFGYRLHWVDQVPVGGALARTVATRYAHGGVPGQPRPADLTKVVIDFEGPAVKGLGQQDGVTPEVTAPAGVEIVNPYALPVVGTDRWRLIFDVRAPAGTDTLDLRAYLSRDGAPLTETWLGQLHPAQLHGYFR